jgi:three-Cys-motif partner protein
LQKYAGAFATITQAHRFTKVYVDGFAGSGLYEDRDTRELVHGSALRALQVQPPFDELHLVELDPKRAQSLRGKADDRRVHVYQGNCNALVPGILRKHVRYDRYERALCLLDPFGLQLKWDVVLAAAKTNAADVLINLPIEAINRNVLRRRGARTATGAEASMTQFWGDESWRNELRRPSPQLHLFDEEHHQKVANEQVAQAYVDRLRNVAGFKCVARPIPMKNSRNAVVYYLVFGSHKDVAVKVMNDIAANQDAR